MALSNGARNETKPHTSFPFPKQVPVHLSTRDKIPYRGVCYLVCFFVASWHGNVRPPKEHPASS